MFDFSSQKYHLINNKFITIACELLCDHLQVATVLAKYEYVEVWTVFLSGVMFVTHC